MADTGSVEVSSYKQYIVQQLADGGKRSDGRLQLTDLRVPSILAADGAKVNSSAGNISSSHGVTSSPTCSSTTAEDGKASSPSVEAGYKKSGRLLSRMYTDDRGTCILCEIEGLFAPPPLRSRKEGRLTVHVACPFLRRHGRDMTSGGGVDLLRHHTNHRVLSSTDEDLGRRQLEGYLSRVLHRCVDMQQLCIIEGEACWMLAITVTLWNVDGGLRGATLLVVVDALRALTLPQARLPNGRVVEPRRVPLIRTPLACTYGVLSLPESSKRLKTKGHEEAQHSTSSSDAASAGSRPPQTVAGSSINSTMLWLADLTAAEEMVVDGHVTLTLDEHGGIVEVGQIGSTVSSLRAPILDHWSHAHMERRKQLGWC